MKTETKAQLRERISKLTDIANGRYLVACDLQELKRHLEELIYSISRLEKTEQRVDRTNFNDVYTK